MKEEVKLGRCLKDNVPKAQPIVIYSERCYQNVH